MTVGLAILSGIGADALDSTESVDAALRRGVTAGGFTLHDLRIVKFSPQGVTGAAIVGESHLTIHTWPEEGRLFIDVASCSSDASVDRAIEAIASAFDGARVEKRELVRVGLDRDL